MNERDFVPVYMHAFEKTVDRCWWYKIPDNRYTGKKPYDVYGWYERDGGHRNSFAFEFKFRKNLDSFQFNEVTEYQVQSLLAADSFGADARVILGVRMLLSFSEQAKLKLPNRRIAIDKDWDIADFVKLQERSLSIRELLKNG